MLYTLLVTLGIVGLATTVIAWAGAHQEESAASCDHPGHRCGHCHSHDLCDIKKD